MPPHVPRAVVLGPQPGRISLGAGLEALELPPGPVAAITVGWRETEPVLKEVEQELGQCGREAAPLHIGERVGRVFERDAPLAEAHRALQEGLLAEERLYGARLRRAVETAHEVVRLSVAERYRDPYAEQAWQAILDADRFHVDRHAELWRDFREAVGLGERPAIRAEREELERLLAGAAAVVLTGGHVAVIRNRLLLLGLSRRAGAASGPRLVGRSDGAHPARRPVPRPAAGRFGASGNPGRRALAAPRNRPLPGRPHPARPRGPAEPRRAGGAGGPGPGGVAGPGGHGPLGRPVLELAGRNPAALPRRRRRDGPLVRPGRGRRGVFREGAAP